MGILCGDGCPNIYEINGECEAERWENGKGLEIEDWRVKIGDWRLEIGDWRLEIGDWRLVSSPEIG